MATAIPSITEKREATALFPRPRLVVSRCLNFEHCRYNGDVIRDDFTATLTAHVDVITVCPEVQIGLGVPRHPIRLVQTEKGIRLRQPATHRDVTAKMDRFGREFLHRLSDVDGFLLKSRSPSCGIKDVKVFSGDETKGAFGKQAGLFGAAVLQRYGHLAVEDEGRLNNFRIREHFLTKLFTLARFRQLRVQPSVSKLVDFHARHKLLLMAYHQQELRRLGQIVANPQRRSIEDLVSEYASGLYRALARMARFSSHINVLMHGLGYFSKELSGGEKRHFLDVLEDYRAERVPLSQPVGILQAWIVRFQQAYLAQQTYYQPYPKALTAITDSGKGRGQ